MKNHKYIFVVGGVMSGVGKGIATSSIGQILQAKGFKVNPVKIAIVNTPMKNVFVKGRRGTVSGMKKAIITVRKGEKIDFV